jgi:4,5-DOPA dioxygenase extradiol
MPAIFVGHGNPMNAISSNAFTARWTALGASLPKPKAILSISAHWYVPETAVTASGHPRTIHDFGGFPKPLYDVAYPAPGSPGLADRVRELLAPIPVRLDHAWGLDHGTWSVLVHMYRAADIPVLQLSIDETREASWHYEVAKQLQPLRDEGVLILGSGNLVHNLHAYSWGDRSANRTTGRFDSKRRRASCWRVPVSPPWSPMNGWAATPRCQCRHPTITFR